MRLFLFLLITLSACASPSGKIASEEVLPKLDTLANVPEAVVLPDSTGIAEWIVMDYPVTSKRYFKVLDSLVIAALSRGHAIDEYALIHANSWILDTLRSFDYYNLTEKGRFVYDPTSLLVIKAGDSLGIPDSLHVVAIQNRLKKTVIDVNIPAFRLHLIQGPDTLVNSLVRVGKNAQVYLEVIHRKADLKTPVGVGEIVRIAREPLYINPRDGKRYEGTTRDDGQYTAMPIIPWIEPSINGIRYGAMIHPTTNRATLGKAYSHGCVGTREDDAWTIYYNSPLGTKVNFRYDLKEYDNGDSLQYPDIYGVWDN